MPGSAHAKLRLRGQRGQGRKGICFEPNGVRACASRVACACAQPGVVDGGHSGAASTVGHSRAHRGRNEC
eukprot:12523896-Alexandrium_andersonii.AAC.1